MSQLPRPHSLGASFDGVLTFFGNNTGIVVPPEVVAQLNAGKRAPVSVDVNGHAFRSTIAVMNGQSLIGVSAAIRKSTGLAGGDPIHVELVVDNSPRPVEMPDDFAHELRATPKAEAFFQGLPNSIQRYHVDQVTSAKTAETRNRRITKSIDLFVVGKRR